MDLTIPRPTRHMRGRYIEVRVCASIVYIENNFIVYILLLWQQTEAKQRAKRRRGKKPGLGVWAYIYL